MSKEQKATILEIEQHLQVMEYFMSRMRMHIDTALNDPKEAAEEEAKKGMIRAASVLQSATAEVTRLSVSAILGVEYSKV